MHHLILGFRRFSWAKRVWLYKDLKVSDMQATTKLAQLDKHQTGMAEVSSLVLTGSNIFLLIFSFYVIKPLMPILPIYSSL